MASDHKLRWSSYSMMSGQDIAAYIKKEFDKKYNPTWHCIVGRNFGSYVTHETKHFIYFYLGQVAILLFKSGWLLPCASNEICLFWIMPGASRNDLSFWHYEKQSHLFDENDRVQIGFIFHKFFKITGRMKVLSHHQLKTFLIVADLTHLVALRSQL